MSSITNRILGSFLLLLGGAEGLPAAESVSTDPAGNWHQWRGPNADGSAKGKPPVEWGEDRNIRWKAVLPGEGSSTPIVWGEQVFILTAIPLDRKGDPPPEADSRALTRPPANYHRFEVVSLDRYTGRTVWTRTAAEEVPHEGRHPTHSYAAASPVTDGERLYVSFGSRGIYCYDLRGELIWKRDLGDMRTRYGWGEAASPALHGDRLVVNWDHEDQSLIVALDARTGRTIWEVERDEPTSWATPLILPHQGRVQVIVNGTTRTRSYDLADGGVLWQSGGQTLNVIPSPVRFGDHVICMSGYKGHVVLSLPLGAEGDITEGNRFAWRYDRGTPYVPSPVLMGGRLYFTQANSPILTALDAGTGEVILKEERLPELRTLYGSPVAAGGLLYFVDREGVCLVVEPEPRVRMVSTNRLEAGIDASPAIAGRQLFLRGRSSLYCIEDRLPSP